MLHLALSVGPTKAGQVRLRIMLSWTMQLGIVRILQRQGHIAAVRVHTAGAPSPCPNGRCMGHRHALDRDKEKSATQPHATSRAPTHAPQQPVHMQITVMGGRGVVHRDETGTVKQRDRTLPSLLIMSPPLSFLNPPEGLDRNNRNLIRESTHAFACLEAHHGERSSGNTPWPVIIP